MVNRKFSVIIPTMLRCVEITNKLLASLYEDDVVSEVIIIDNASKKGLGVNYVDPLTYTSRLLYNKKTKYNVPGHNLYVNPSWNLGVSLAKEEYIAILNDDITVPERVFSTLSTLSFEDFGVIGAGEEWILETESPSRFTVKRFSVLQAPIRNNGFGLFMAMHKSRYTTCPDEIKIWYSDDLQFHANRVAGYPNGIFTFPIMTKMSATSGDDAFKAIKENDGELYREYKLKHNL